MSSVFSDPAHMFFFAYLHNGPMNKPIFHNLETEPVVHLQIISSFLSNRDIISLFRSSKTLYKIPLTNDIFLPDSDKIMSLIKTENQAKLFRFKLHIITLNSYDSIYSKCKHYRMFSSVKTLIIEDLEY